MAATDPISNALFEWWGGTEATFGAGGASNPAADDAFIHETADVGPVSASRIIEVGDKTGERTHRSPVQGAYDPIPWTLRMPLRPSYLTATDPDYGFLFKAGGFSSTLGVFSRQRSPSVSGWMWATSHDGKCGRSFAGVATEKITISGGDGIAVVEFAGNAAAKSEVYETTLGGNVLLGASSFTLASGHGWVVPSGGAPVYLTIGAETVKVTSVSGDTATISGTFAGPHTLGDAVTPYRPSRTYASQTEPMDPVAEQTHSLDLNNGSEEIYVVDFQLEIDTGVKLRRKEAHASFVRGLHGNRAAPAVLTANLVFLLGDAKLSGYLAALTTKDLQIKIGPTTGRYIQIDANTLKLRKVDVPESAEDGAAEGTIEGAVYTTAAQAGADLSISYL